MHSAALWRSNVPGALHLAASHMSVRKALCATLSSAPKTPKDEANEE
jgi:hypothetical protein